MEMEMEKWYTGKVGFTEFTEAGKRHPIPLLCFDLPSGSIWTFVI